MNKLRKSKAATKFNLAQIESIPNQIGYIICTKDKIVQSTIPNEDNPVQIASNGYRLAVAASGPEFANHLPHSIQVQFSNFLYEMFQAGQYFVIVKKKLDEAEE